MKVADIGKEMEVANDNELMDFYLTPAGYPISMSINPSNTNKIDLDTNFGHFSLDCREAPECIIFRKIIQQNSKGETRIVYKKANYSKIYWAEPQRFCDFHYDSALKKNDMINFLEGSPNFSSRCLSRSYSKHDTKQSRLQH